MKLYGVTTGLMMLLGGSQAVAAPQLEYMAVGATDAAGIPGGRKAWELRDSLSRSFNYRVTAHTELGFRYKDEEWVVHNLTTDSRGVSMLLDWHPLGGRFRFSGGVFSHKQSLDYVVAPTIDGIFKYKVQVDPAAIVQELQDELLKEGITVDAAELEEYLPDDMSPQVITIKRHVELDLNDLSVHARVKYNSAAPYLGMGWSNPFFSHSRLRYSWDLGVLYQGEPDIDLAMQGAMLDDAKPAVQTWLDEWAFEQKLKLAKKMEKHTLSPRLGVGLSYRLY